VVVRVRGPAARQGDKGEDFYVILNGSVNVIIHDSSTSRARPRLAPLKGYGACQTSCTA